jgi:hypothetical protein
MLKKLFRIVYYAALIPSLNGYVTAMLWRWFVVVAFHVAPISLPVAAGLYLLSNFLLVHVASSGDTRELKNMLEAAKLSDDDLIKKSMVRSVLMPLAVLGMGAVIHLFV